MRSDRWTDARAGDVADAGGGRGRRTAGAVDTANGSGDPGGGDSTEASSPGDQPRRRGPRSAADVVPSHLDGAVSRNGQPVTGYIVRAAKVPITDGELRQPRRHDRRALHRDAGCARRGRSSRRPQPLRRERLLLCGRRHRRHQQPGRDCRDGDRCRGAAERDRARRNRRRDRAVRVPDRRRRRRERRRQVGSAGRRGRRQARLSVLRRRRRSRRRPASSFTGDATTTASFGRGVAYIGDIDKDGRPDIAISDRGTPAHIYIYKGRATWPAAMANTDADYVITVDATYNSSILGASMARLGDFNGDGTDDFALGAPLVRRGAAAGGSSSSSERPGFANITLPDATNSLVIDADPAITNPQFGYRVVGLGHFYSATPGRRWWCRRPATPLPRAASKAGSTRSTAAGTPGRWPRPPPIMSSSVRRAPIASVWRCETSGRWSMRCRRSAAGTLSNACRRPTATPMSSAAAAASGPFASKVVVFQGAGGGLTGQAIVGGGISGSDQVFSIVGDATPDSCWHRAIRRLSRSSTGAQFAARRRRSTPTRWRPPS